MKTIILPIAVLLSLNAQAVRELKRLVVPNQLVGNCSENFGAGQLKILQTPDGEAIYYSCEVAVFTEADYDKIDAFRIAGIGFYELGLLFEARNIRDGEVSAGTGAGYGRPESTGVYDGTLNLVLTAQCYPNTMKCDQDTLMKAVYQAGNFQDRSVSLALARSVPTLPQPDGYNCGPYGVAKCEDTPPVTKPDDGSSCGAACYGGG